MGQDKGAKGSANTRYLYYLASIAIKNEVLYNLMSFVASQKPIEHGQGGHVDKIHLIHNTFELCGHCDAVLECLHTNLKT